jgi:hypothetical protein
MTGGPKECLAGRLPTRASPRAGPGGVQIAAAPVTRGASFATQHAAPLRAPRLHRLGSGHTRSSRERRRLAPRPAERAIAHDRRVTVRVLYEWSDSDTAAPNGDRSGIRPAMRSGEGHRRRVLRLQARADGCGAEWDRASPDPRLPLPELGQRPRRALQTRRTDAVSRRRARAAAIGRQRSFLKGSRRNRRGALSRARRRSAESGDCQCLCVAPDNKCPAPRSSLTTLVRSAGEARRRWAASCCRRRCCSTTSPSCRRPSGRPCSRTSAT